MAKAVQIIEEDYQEKEGIRSLPGQVNSFQNLIDAKTLTIHVTLKVTFELKAKERDHHHHHRQQHDEKRVEM